MTPTCPTCNSADLISLGRLPDSAWFAGMPQKDVLPGGVLYRCDRCRLKFRFPIQSASVYAQMYNNSRTDNWAAEGERPDWELIIATLQRLRPDAANVLDFGCYAGGLLARIRGGRKLFGVEINREAAIVAQETSGATVWCSIAEIPPDLRFDVVIAADVVEHVRDPKQLIRQMLSLLTDRGILIITTGDADTALWRRFGANWWYCYYAEHIAFICKSWLEFLAKTSAVTLIEFTTFSYRRLGTTRRVLDTMAMYGYGHFPRTFLGLKKTFQRLRGRERLPNVPGNGISADHLLVVLAPGSKR